MRPCCVTPFLCISHFNPRIPCGMRQKPPLTGLNPNLFQSTHPMRDATESLSRIQKAAADFNPRIPCGMRLFQFWLPVIPTAFQSTHPMRDATGVVDAKDILTDMISIHASHAGCDCSILRFKSFKVISIHASHAGCDQD